MIFAVVNPAGGVVSNTVVGDDQEVVESIVGPCVLQTEETGVAGIGYTWDGMTFIPPSPYPSWVWNSELKVWEAPVPMPEEGNWAWNEDTQTWQEV